MPLSSEEDKFVKWLLPRCRKWLTHRCAPARTRGCAGAGRAPFTCKLRGILLHFSGQALGLRNHLEVAGYEWKRNRLRSNRRAPTRRSFKISIYQNAATTAVVSGCAWNVDRVRSLRVLLFVTFRPDFEPPWVDGRM